jgi:hypothetical protein
MREISKVSSGSGKPAFRLTTTIRGGARDRRRGRARRSAAVVLHLRRTAPVAELGEDLRPISPFTQWLYAQFTDPPSFVDIGGAWPLGDSPLVLLTAISQESSTHRDQQARRIMSSFQYGDAIPGRTVRVYETLDARLTFADFLAHLRRNARETGAAPAAH